MMAFRANDVVGGIAPRPLLLLHSAKEFRHADRAVDRSVPPRRPADGPAPDGGRRSFHVYAPERAGGRADPQLARQVFSPASGGVSRGHQGQAPDQLVTSGAHRRDRRSARRPACPYGCLFAVLLRRRAHRIDPEVCEQLDDLRIARDRLQRLGETRFSPPPARLPSPHSRSRRCIRNRRPFLQPSARRAVAACALASTRQSLSPCRSSPARSGRTSCRNACPPTSTARRVSAAWAASPNGTCTMSSFSFPAR